MTGIPFFDIGAFADHIKYHYMITIINSFIALTAIYLKYIHRRWPEFFWNIIDELDFRIIKFNIERSVKQNNEQKLIKNYINNSITKIRSKGESKKTNGLAELKFRSKHMDDNNKKYTVKELFKCYNIEKDKSFKQQILALICKICKKAIK